MLNARKMFEKLGYEYKKGKWKRTLKAIWYKWF